MKPVRRAVIDIGTNSVKLLVAEVVGTEIRPVWEESRQTRLGRGFYETHRLQPGPLAKTAGVVAEFATRAREHGADSVRAIATSAARDAVNAEELTASVETASGLRVEIISGEQEADWTFRGVTTDPHLANTPLVLLDVGGGSTEFIVGQGLHQHYSASFPLGTVRLLEQLRPAEPPKPEDLAACREAVRKFLAEQVCPALQPALERECSQSDRGGPSLVGAGGTASVLGCMEAKLSTFDRERLEATRLSLEHVRCHVERLWGLPLAERQQTPGLPKNRADVILTGTAIYEGVMEQFGFNWLGITTRGLRFAAVMSAD